MNTLELKVNINLTNAAEIAALNVFTKSLAEAKGAANITPATQTEQPIKAEEAPKRTRAPKKVEAKAEEEFEESLKPKQVEEEPQPTETKPAPTTKAQGITIDDIRKLVSEKAEAHRSEIKEKLTELGAKNVSTLEEENYQEMADFLNSLK